MGFFNSPYLNQLTTALEQSANFGTNCGEHDIKDPEGMSYIQRAFDMYFNDFFRTTSFNNAGNDYENGDGNLFHIYTRIDDADKAKYPNLANYNLQNVLDLILNKIFGGGGIVGYIVDADYSSQCADITVRLDPYTENQKQNDVSQNVVDATDGTVKTVGQASSTTYPATNSNVADLGTVELASPPSDESRKTVLTSTTDTSEFFKDCIVLLEGVQVSYNTITVSYGVSTPATCNLILPAHRVIRELPECTKIHIFFKDFLQDSDGEYKWRLLFDGEMTGYAYNTNERGATVSINGIHSCAYTTLMQIMTLDAAQYLFNTQSYIAGDSTIPIMFGQNRMHSTMIADLLKSKYKTMADLVYQMIRGILEGNDQTGTGKYYASKLGNGTGAWKILKRIYGVSANAANAPAPKTNWSTSVANESSKTNTSNKTGSYDYHGTGNMQRPCPGSITSPYGYRDHPIDGEVKFHDGIDIGADTGTPVRASDNGTVVQASWNGGYGNYIRINHGNGVESFYGHLDSIGVSEGQTVNKGDVIGEVGNTGNSTGPHLHFGIWLNGESADPMNYIS